MNRDSIEINGRIWIYDPSSRTHRPAEAAGIDDRASVPSAAAQRTKRDAPAKTREGYAFNQRVDVEVYTYRVRTCDTEGPSVKAALDGIVACGVIKDDSAKEVESVKFYAVRKAESKATQKTVIKIRVAR